ncbi:MAG: hypothetical protein ABMA13_04425 [Chthoniobacteraceae bacterium]
MSPRTLFLPVLFIATLLGGCASSIPVYSGPRRSAGQVAVLPQDEAQRQIRILSVDGRRISRRADLELLPGSHTVEVIYRPPSVVRSYPVSLRFNAVAGHRYVMTAKMLQGAVDGSGLWGGKYQVLLYDLNGVREVARSQGPAAPPRIEH